jgi:putative ABC transport system permease protein
LTVVNLPSVDSPEGMNVTVRGILPIGISMRDVVIDQGSMIQPGLRQIIVGQSIAHRYPDAQIGKKLRFGRGSWEVVGVFHVGESASNSEIWVDLNQLRGDFERAGGSSSLLIRCDSDAGKKQLTDSISGDQRLGSDVIDEKEYYRLLTSSGAPIEGLGFSVAIIMAIGSAFAATNTMYAAVSRRTREIGTLRALGFSRGSILMSFMIESICLALIGGILGVLIAFPVNGMTTGVGSFQTFSETAFKFHVGPVAILAGLLFAVIIGALGGFLPAWSASKKGIIAAMRDL